MEVAPNMMLEGVGPKRWSHIEVREATADQYPEVAAPGYAVAALTS